MDKNLKKIKYQELFLSELRNSYFGEKKLEETLREMETKENMKKLANALKKIWKQTDENVDNLKDTFPKSEVKEDWPDIAARPAVRKEDTEPINRKVPEIKDSSPLENPSGYQILSYDNLVQLVDDLDIEQITEILKSASASGSNNHQYLTKLAEKLVRERDSKA